MQEFDYIIVGQGIAGSVLAYQLLKADKRVIVLNDESLPTSSAVAGGIFNPVTGKNLDKTWLADTLFPFSREFYLTLEKETHTRFYYETNLFRPYANEQQRRHFLQLTDEYDLSKYIQLVKPNQYQSIENSLGGLFTTLAGWVDVPLMLSALKKLFVQKAVYQAEKFDYPALVLTNEQVSYKTFSAPKIIFCDGYYAMQNPYFNWLPFNPAKGETLIATMTDYSIKEIVNQGAWIIPLGNQQYRFGSTYSWNQLDWLPTQESRENITGKIDKFLKIPYQVIDQQAGIRPTTKDRRPFLGNHPAYGNVYSFNGLGTKGVSLAPYFAQEMLYFLESKKDLPTESNIRRFYSLYSLQDKV
ncbi:FAD-binding oxidoreductase [Emticicia sp. TH156]|uniref:NAD(P)/FAD-dependent oxidoreductase n=1 Tax=Emticicia sp. TH156 TaxID=2067454 RepID=UPI000C761488|nr:FAD-binding oxidoreductase [Emticicia sp. TH156]PLK43077.1 FAD-dependent oxidoreductase [Emticicia sp. TH156]